MRWTQAAKWTTIETPSEKKDYQQR
jgi:hypothetical protein